MMTYSRDDVETHYGSDRPAVNIKVYASLEDGFEQFEREDPEHDRGFTLDWIRGNASDDALDARFWDTCAFELEMVEQDACEVFAAYSGWSLEQDGRSGGWLVVTGLPDLGEWDAVLLARWRRFERLARATAAGVMCQLVSSLYLNEWELREDPDDAGAESPVAEYVASC